MECTSIIGGIHCARQMSVHGRGKGETYPRESESRQKGRDTILQVKEPAGSRGERHAPQQGCQGVLPKVDVLFRNYFDVLRNYTSLFWL